MQIRLRHFEESNSATVAIISTLVTGGTAAARQLITDLSDDVDHTADNYDAIAGFLMSSLWSLRRFTYSVKYPCLAFVASFGTKSAINLLELAGVTELPAIALGTSTVAFFYYGYKKFCEKSNRRLLKIVEAQLENRTINPQLKLA